MLTQPKFTKTLSLKENLAKQYQDTDRQLQQFREPDHDHLKSMVDRLGKVYTHTDFITIVQRLNSKVWPETSNADPTVVGLYYMQGRNKRYVTSFDKGFVPEFTFINVDRADLQLPTIFEEPENNLPKGFKKGWRQVLVELLKKRLITKKQIKEAFGYVPSNTRTERYLRNLSTIS